ncbi:MAG: flavin reductase family protein [Deferribacterales bacterium]|jgi:flavin reductase (DIM6/NTAB) family NADH-FMN oxidoreductase RutF
MRFKELEPGKLTGNTFKMIGEQWMLVTAGEKDNFNTMTASWGGLGVMWNKNVSYVVVRPTRYTYEFMEKYDHYTLSFLDDEYRDALTLCGTKSGRDMDKVKKAGLTPVFDGKGIYFEQAKIAMVCKKLYWQDLEPNNFLDEAIMTHYKTDDYHRLYIGEIVDMYEQMIINPLDLQ